MSGKEVVPGKGNRIVRSSEVTWSLARFPGRPGWDAATGRGGREHGGGEGDRVNSCLTSEDT